MRLTRTGAISSARFAVRAGSAAVSAEMSAEPDGRTPAAGAAHEQQRAARPHLAGGVAGDVRAAARGASSSARRACVEVHLGQRRVVRAAGGDHHVVDRRRQVLEEPLERGRSRWRRRPRCSARRARAPRARRRSGLRPVRIDVGSLGARAPGRLEPDAGAAADHDDGLPEELRLALGAPSRRSRAPAARIAAARSRRGAPSARRRRSPRSVGNGWIVSRSTSSGTRARIASVACCSHSPASGPSA